MDKLAYQIGVQTALYKLGGARVLVTQEQTPQEQSEPMNMAAEQQRTVEHLWDEHDKRQQLFTARNPD